LDKSCSDPGKRDRALLALGFGGIRRSKTDQEGQGHEIAIPHGTQLLPVRAVQAWMQAARITDGNLFRSIDRHGRVGGALTAQSVALIVKAHQSCRSGCAGVRRLQPARWFSHQRRRGRRRRAAHA